MLALLLVFAIVVVGRTATVRGTSMTPTLHEGQVLLVESVSHRVGRLQRGDIVVVDVSTEQWLLAELAGGRFVKRIVGLPGETMAIVDGRVLIDGEPLDEPYVQQRAQQTLPPVRVPAGAYYVLGDNRTASDDSREWGPVPVRAIMGRVWFVLWPLTELRLL